MRDALLLIWKAGMQPASVFLVVLMIPTLLVSMAFPPESTVTGLAVVAFILLFLAWMTVMLLYLCLEDGE